MVNAACCFYSGPCFCLSQLFTYIYSNQKIKSMFLSPEIGPYQVVFGLPNDISVIVLN